MKILQLGKFYPIYGGVEKVMWDITRGLAGRNVQCDMLCCGLKGEMDSYAHAAFSGHRYVIRFNDSGSCIVVPALTKLAATMISPRLILELRRICGSYDIVHVHHPDPMAVVALWLSGYRGKVVLHWHSDILKQKGLLKLYRPFLNWIIRRSDAIVGTTPVYVQSSLFLKDVQNKTMAIPIGIHPVAADSEGAERIRARYPGKRIVYSLGRLVAYKGYRYLVEAARFLSDNYVILIGGDGPEKKALADLIGRYGLEGKVELLGYIDKSDFAAYYSACDVFALSSIYKTEAFAIVQIEAMSCGKPVVATQIEGSGVSWVNRNGYSGLNVQAGDPRALAGAVMEITSEKSGYEGYCQNARRHYEEMFRYDLMIDRLSELYGSLI